MKYLIFMLLFFTMNLGARAQDYQTDVFNTSGGELKITFIAHATLMMQYNNIVVHIDPVTMFGTDYSKMPKADLILITHAHGDHMDPKAIEQIRKDNTTIIVTSEVQKALGYGVVMNNGDHRTVDGIEIEAVPAYNLNSSYHPKGVGNGYVLQFGDERVYVAGDTENIPEMKNLGHINIAFIPMNRPYTMTPEMAADAARMIHPDILYPYHFGETDTDSLVDLLQDQKDIEIRIRNLQ